MSKWRLLVGLTLTAGALGLAGCGSDSASGVAVQPPVALASMPVALQTVVTDAATGLPITVTAPDTITVYVYGVDANKVVDGNGNSLYSAANQYAGPLTATNGIFTIYVKPGTPAPAQMTLRVVASARNYIVSSRDLVINSSDLHTDGTTISINVPISLVSTASGAQPASVVAATTPVSLTNGTTGASQITVVTPQSTTTVNGAAVTLGTATVAVDPSTTIYADAAKTVKLPAGTTAINVTYNNNTVNSSLATFPGGFVTQQDPNGAALSSPGGFISGGFASIEVTSTAADGTVTKAKAFDKPITVTIEIPSATVNPETGLAVKAGDVIPIWSYDSTTGAWSVMKMNSTGTIITGTLGALNAADNTFPVTFQTDHLSYFNLDWFYWKTTIPGKSNVLMCDSAPITIKGAGGKRLYLEASMVGGGWVHPWWLDAGAVDPASNKITYAPKNLKMKIDAYVNTDSPDPAKKVGSVTVDNVCAGVTLDVTAGMASQPQTSYANVPIKVRELCDTNPGVGRDVPSAGVYAFASGAPYVSTATDSTGLGTLASLIVGKNYTFYVYGRNGQTKKANYTVQTSNATQEFDFTIKCGGTTGSTGSTSQGNF